VSRNRKSAKAAGSKFNWDIARALADALGDNNITKAPAWGAKDKGDIVNVKIDGHPIVIQTKDVARLSLPEGVGDAKVQAVNADALCGLFVHKRVGTTDPMKQWVSCTLAEFIALVTKVPVHAGAAEGKSKGGVAST
jgi:hypothetical protein